MSKEQMRKELKSFGTRVREILKDDEKARNCDKYLFFKVMQQILHQTEDGRLIICLSDLMIMPSPETLIRMRAKIQNVEHRFMPTIEAVRKKRRIKEEVYREWGQTNF